jgi:hypothetical protein
MGDTLPEVQSSLSPIHVLRPCSSPVDNECRIFPQETVPILSHLDLVPRLLRDSQVHLALPAL